MTIQPSWSGARVALRFGILLALALATGCAVRVPPASPADRAAVRVSMFTTRWCPVCAHARAWFQRRGIPIDEYDVETQPRAAARHRQLNPSRTVPTIDVEGEVIVGFTAEHVRQAVDRAAHRHCVEDRGEAACAPRTP